MAVKYKLSERASRKLDTRKIEADRLKELQGSDYSKLGLSRGKWATVSGDDEKMAKSIVANAKAENKDRDVGYYQNSKGEFVIQENGKNLGVVNKAGLSKQDVYGVLRDPTNLLMLVPGLNLVGGAVKGLSLGAKALRAVKLGSAVAGADLATTTAADITNGEGLKNVENNTTRALTAGVSAPVGEVIIGKALTKIANKVAPKKVKLEQGDVPLTKGQATGNKADLSYETDVRKGEKGAKAQEILNKFNVNQMDIFKKTLSDDLPVSFDDVGRNKVLGDSLHYNLRAEESEKLNLKNALYARVNKDGLHIDAEDAKTLVSSLENALDKRARANVEAFKKTAPEKEAIEFIDNWKESLTDTPMDLGTFENSRETLNSILNVLTAKHTRNSKQVASGMAVNTSLDEGLLNLARDNKLIGDKKQFLNLLEARKAEADYSKKFKNHDNQGEKLIIDLIDEKSLKDGSNISNVFAGNLEDLKLGVINKIKEIAGKGGDKELREIVLNNIFTDVGRVGRDANINPNEAIKKVIQRVEKSDKVAKKLFSPNEIKRITEAKDLLQKINTYYDVNPSGTASKGVFNSALGFLPIPQNLGGDAVKAVKSTYNVLKLKKYLNSKTINQNRFNENSLVAKLGSRLGIVIGNQSKQLNN